MKTYTTALVALVLVACSSGTSALISPEQAEDKPPSEDAAKSSTTSTTKTSESPDAAPVPDDAASQVAEDADVPDSSLPPAEAGPTITADCTGTIAGAPWTYVVSGGQACASADNGSGCVPCVLTSTDTPQCQVEFSGANNWRQWAYSFNPVTQVVYISVTSKVNPPGSWTPACNP